MKYVVLICDGAADYPLDELGGKTPLQAADKPNMDSISEKGRNGLLKTIPDGYAPGSDVANLAILGYEADRYFPGGRGVIEAASQGVDVGTDEVPMRANIISVKDGRIADYSAGNIKSGEAARLIEEANRVFGNDRIRFYPGVSYRNLLVIKDADLDPGDFEFDAPHDYPGGRIEKHLPRGRGSAAEWAKRLSEIMLESQEVFGRHEVNKKRVADGKEPANMLWFWGPGKKRRDMPPMKELFGVGGVVITGIDLIKGLGKLAGLDVLEVEGATAYHDTDYEGKAKAAIDALNGGRDIAVIHVEAPDEAGHEGDAKEKIRAIENIDKRLLGRVLDGIESESRIGILPDHYTSVMTKTHEAGPVPFSIAGPGIERDAVARFDEMSAKLGGYGLREGPEFMGLLTSH